MGRLSFYPVPNIDMGSSGQGRQGLVPWLRRADFSAMAAAHVSTGMDWFVSTISLMGASWLCTCTVGPVYACARGHATHFLYPEGTEVGQSREVADRTQPSSFRVFLVLV